MSEGADSARPVEPEVAGPLGEAPREAVRRIFRDTFWAALVAVAVSAFLAPWRVTLGLALGGALALFNQHWLRSSVEAVFEGASAARPPRMKAARYVLRYAVVAGLLAEGFRQFYFAIVRREET